MKSKRRGKMTARIFAEEMDVDYSTVIRWLKQGLVPGAELKESEDRGKWWEIPQSALKMKTPKPGRKRAKKEGAGDEKKSRK
jgi:predicted site-specific integrase-resolvase